MLRDMASPKSALRVLLPLVSLALAATGCRRLPETIPYQAIIVEKSGESGNYRITELVGAELALDGTKLGQIQQENTKVSVNVTWSGPKSELRSTLNGKYTVKATGPCGPFDLAAEGPPPNWKALTDGEIAKSIKDRKTFSIYLDVKMPPKHAIYIDRGAATGTLRIGPTTIEPGKKIVDVVLGGCASAPTVTLDGAPIGALDLTARANLVTLEPNVCHVLADVAYGDKQTTRPATYYPAKSVVSIAERPGYVLESAPSSLKLRGGGTTTTELLRARCR